MDPASSLSALLGRLSRLPGEVEEMVGNVASMPRSWWMQSFPYPLVNVREKDEAFHIEADVPGVPLDRIEVVVQNGVELILQGERLALGDANGTWHHRERGDGRFHRVLTLPVPVDADKVEAQLEHGVLRLLLPKAEMVKTRRVPVQASNGSEQRSSPE